MSVLILPGRFKAQPPAAPLNNPEFWRLVDIQDRPPISAAPVTRTLNNTASLKYGVSGAAVNFAATGDWISYAANSDLQLSTMTGIAVIEMPNTTAQSTLFNTNVGGTNSGGFIIRVDDAGKIAIAKLDIVAICITAKRVKKGTGVSTVAWSYNNVTGLCRVAIDGTLEKATSAQTLTHGTVARNRYYSFNPTYSSPHKSYLFALSASDAASDAQLIEWSINPWQLFRAPARKLWAVTAAGGTSHDLTGAPSSEGNTGSTAGITQDHALVGSNGAQANTSSASAITQTHALSVAASSQANVSVSVSIGASINLAGAASAQGNVCSTGAITQTQVLTASTSAQNGTSSAVVMTQFHVLSGPAATQGNLGSTGAISVISEFIGAPSTQGNISSAGQITRTQTLTGASSTQANLSGTGAISDGIVVEAALTTGIGATIRIKKPGIPAGTSEWLKTMLEIIIGRRGNAIEIPEFQTLTFSATPTKTECEALYSYTNTVRDSLEQLINRMDS